MNFKKIWFWFSAVLATSTVLFVGLNIPLSFLDGFMGLDFYHFVILGIILFPFLLKYLASLANGKIFPNYFFWFIIFIALTFPPIIIILTNLSDFFVSFGGPPTSILMLPISILLTAAIIVFFKSKRLS